MFERSPDSPSVNSSEETEAASPRLHLAIFDLANRAFVSARFDAPTLLVDYDESSALSPARRIESFHSRNAQHYNLPPLKSMGFLHTEDESMIVSAAQPAYMHSVRFRDFALRRYNLEELHSHVQKLNEAGEETQDTLVIDAAFKKLPELRRYKAAS
jgi:hypothetical protein